jgi:hypothetical protein
MVTLVVDGHIISDVEKFIRLALTASDPMTDDAMQSVALNALKEMRALVTVPDRSTHNDIMWDSPDDIHRDIFTNVLGNAGVSPALTKLDKVGITTEAQLKNFIIAAHRPEGFGAKTIGLIAEYVYIRGLTSSPENIVSRFYKPGWHEYNLAMNTIAETKWRRWNTIID